jgi:hypothetical protein
MRLLVAIATALMLLCVGAADAKQWGKGNRPAPGIGRCGYSIALDCKGKKRAPATWTVPRRF